MSAFTYNTVSLHMLETQEFSVVPEMDPTSTDQLWSRYFLRVRGVLAPGVGDASQNESPGDILVRIKHLLNTVRRPLFYRNAGTTIVDITDPPDANKGPTPKGLRVWQILEGSFMVDFSIEWCAADCENGLGYASLRWTQTESVDLDTWLRTYRTTGLLICRTDVRTNPDSLRGVVAPAKLPGYKRSASYTLEPDGTRLKFEFVDKQMAVALPSAATKASGWFATTATLPGAVRLGQVSVRLVGPLESPAVSFTTRLSSSPSPSCATRA